VGGGGGGGGVLGAGAGGVACSSPTINHSLAAFRNLGSCSPAVIRRIAAVSVE